MVILYSRSHDEQVYRKVPISQTLFLCFELNGHNKTIEKNVFVYLVLCLGFFHVLGLLCFQLSCLGFVVSWVCRVLCLSCLGFVVSWVCRVLGLSVLGLSVLGLSCLVFVCLTFVGVP